MPRQSRRIKQVCHGLEHTKIYAVWCGMKQRCNNPKNAAFKNYGARGIRLCQERNDAFLQFYDWAMANGYHEGLTIDRFPDNNGNYAPDNCRWATRTQQVIHKRTGGNKSGFRGVNYNGTGRQWRVQLTVNGRYVPVPGAPISIALLKRPSVMTSWQKSTWGRKPS